MVKPEMTGCLSGSTITVRGEEAEWKRKGGLSRVTWHLHVCSRLLEIFKEATCTPQFEPWTRVEEPVGGARLQSPSNESKSQH